MEDEVPEIRPGVLGMFFRDVVLFRRVVPEVEQQRGLVFGFLGIGDIARFSKEMGF